MVDVAAQQLGEASTFSEGGALGVCRRVVKPCKGDQGLSWGEGKAGLFMGGKRKLCPWKSVFTTIFLSFTPLNWAGGNFIRIVTIPLPPPPGAHFGECKLPFSRGCRVVRSWLNGWLLAMPLVLLVAWLSRTEKERTSREK